MKISPFFIGQVFYLGLINFAHFVISLTNEFVTLIQIFPNTSVKFNGCRRVDFKVIVVIDTTHKFCRILFGLGLKHIGADIVKVKADTTFIASVGMRSMQGPAMV